MRLAVALVLLAAPALAQEWKLRDGDVPLEPGALAERLVGRTVTFYDDGQSYYFPDGRYTYTYAGGGVAYGYFRLGEGGTVCVEFVNGFSRCDRYVRAGARLVLLTEDGERFPVRPSQPGE